VYTGTVIFTPSQLGDFFKPCKIDEYVEKDLKVKNVSRLKVLSQYVLKERALKKDVFCPLLGTLRM
jgi:hypothetical protein